MKDEISGQETTIKFFENVKGKRRIDHKYNPPLSDSLKNKDLFIKILSLFDNQKVNINETIK